MLLSKNFDKDLENFKRYIIIEGYGIEGELTEFIEPARNKLMAWTIEACRNGIITKNDGQLVEEKTEMKILVEKYKKYKENNKPGSKIRRRNECCTIDDIEKMLNKFNLEDGLDITEIVFKRSREELVFKKTKNKWGLKVEEDELKEIVF